MGCNGSKSVSAVIADGQIKEQQETTENEENVENIESIENASTRPVTPQSVPPSMAFDIPFNDEDKAVDASIVKKHPPKRLQRLEEQQQNTTPISLEELQEKQQEAENRRLHFLQLRAQSAKRKYAMRNNNDEQNSGDDKSVKNDENDAVNINEGEVTAQ